MLMVDLGGMKIEPLAPASTPFQCRVSAALRGLGDTG